MLVANLLAKKRDGGELRDDEIYFLINGFCSDEVADYQMAALAMAICIQGMSQRETATLTRAMLESGDALSRVASGQTPRVDKHSTGGLGDKVSLVLAPLLASCGVHVPMISGRGLGLSGGTLDKLEAIEGFRTDLSNDAADAVLQRCGSFIVGASANVAPADRRLYALRDVTGTVESVALITASILSKKLSASLDALVMDVKVGRGAFMKSHEQAAQLAESLVRVGEASGLPTSALLSDMDQPLGRAIGNANEVNEAVAVLSDTFGGDPIVQRVKDLTIALCVPALVQVNCAADADDAREQLVTALSSGAAMERFEQLIAAQHGRWKGSLPTATSFPIVADRAGFVGAVDCHLLGSTVVGLGGGRRKMSDQIDPSVGIEMAVQVGDRVEKGQPILILQCHDRQTSEYLEPLSGAVELVDDAIPPHDLICRHH